MRDFVFAGTTILTETKGEQLFEKYRSEAYQYVPSRGALPVR